MAALKFIPLGGMYVAGGLTPKNIKRITEADSPFMAAFFDKGRVSPLLKRIPLYAVLVEDIGQRGAHLVAFRQLRAAAAAPSFKAEKPAPFKCARARPRRALRCLARARCCCCCSLHSNPRVRARV